MKGLQEALRDREERHCRVDRHDISDEDIEANSIVISKLSKGLTVHIEYYCAFHDIEKEGRITEINIPFKYIKLSGERIAFDDIYKIRITDYG